MPLSQAEIDLTYRDLESFLFQQGVDVSGRDNLVRAFGEHRDAFTELLRQDGYTDEEITEKVALFENANMIVNPQQLNHHERAEYPRPLRRDDVLMIVNDSFTSRKFDLASLFLFAYGFQAGGSACWIVTWKNISVEDLQDGNLEVTVSTSIGKTAKFKGPRNINNAAIDDFPWQELFVYALNQHFMARFAEPEPDPLQTQVWLGSSMTYQNRLVEIWGKLRQPGWINLTFGSLRAGGIKDGTLK